MRERTTWNQKQIRQAAMARQADPYLMNQDHVQQQPAADKYVIGDPSTFGEDVNTDNRWEDEYKGGQVSRNDIGEANFLPNTFNHPEKTAAMDESTLLKKANLCVRTAKLMLPKTATELTIEDQATSLMTMPDYDLIETFTRLAEDQEEQEEQVQQKQAQQEQQEQVQEQQKQAQGQDFQNISQQQQQVSQDQQVVSQQQIQQMVAQAVQQALACSRKPANQQVKQEQQQQVQANQQVKQEEQEQQVQANQQQQVVSQQQVQQQIAQAVQQAIQGQQQQQGQSQQQVVSQQQVQQQIAQAVQQALQGQQQQVGDIMIDPMPPVDDMGIELEGPSMDTGDVIMDPGEDDMLRQLFANDESQAQEEQQQGQQQQGQKKAAIRTASTRTVGTRPTAGVSRLGGVSAPNTGSDVDKLASLWTSAPDVSEAFGIKR